MGSTFLLMSARTACPQLRGEGSRPAVVGRTHVPYADRRCRSDLGARDQPGPRLPRPEAARRAENGWLLLPLRLVALRLPACHRYTSPRAVRFRRCERPWAANPSKRKVLDVSTAIEGDRSDIEYLRNVAHATLSPRRCSTRWPPVGLPPVDTAGLSAEALRLTGARVILGRHRGRPGRARRPADRLRDEARESSAVVPAPIRRG